jgi:WD40 repeat protein/tRNA A-37 threonylcarbamoyl transferase component Bud32
MEPSSDACVRCGAALGRAATAGLCAACVLEELLPSAESQAVDGTHPLTLDTPVLQRFGSYELLEEIGRGGMGVIYKARQAGLERLVALKMLLAGEFADAKARDRLLREARIASRLNHPNIVTIFEVGERDGRPFFAMEFVAGPNLAQLNRSGLVAVTTAVRYMARLARAVHYAHQHGVIHRDLKPANVLIGPDDEPKLTDFGLTKSLVDPTRTMESAGSPNFMAPEQADSSLGTTGTQTDVFGLGAILYWLLTGRPPAVGETLTETLRSVVACEPVAPRTLRPGLPVDLETITLKCLEKEGGRRYASALEVAEELERWTRHEPIQARPIQPGERLSKWVRRRPIVAGLVMGCVVLLLAGVLATSWQWRQAERERAAIAARDYTTSLTLASQRLAEGDYLAARRLLMGQPESRRGWEWGRLVAEAHPALLEMDVLTNAPTAGGLDSAGLALSGDGRWIAAVAAGYLEVLDVRERRTVLRLGSEPRPRQRVASCDFSPDSSLLVMAGPGPGFTVWSTGDWQMLRRFGTDRTNSSSARFSPDGRRVVTTASSSVVEVWDPQSGEHIRSLGSVPRTVYDARFSPDGTRILLPGPSGYEPLPVWDAKSGDVVATIPLPGSTYRFVMPAPDGRFYATLNDEGVGSLWEVGGLQPIFQTPAEGSEVVAVIPSSGGTHLAAIRGEPMQVRFWEVGSGRSLPIWSGRLGGVEVSQDGDRLVSGAGEKVVRLWDWNSGQPLAQLPTGIDAFGLKAGTAQEGRVAAALLVPFQGTPSVRVWTLPKPDRLLSPTFPAARAALSPDGRHVALFHMAGQVTLWDAGTGRMERTLHGHFRWVTDGVWGADGQTLFTASADQTVRRWNAASGEQERVYRGAENPLWTMAASRDGRVVVAADSHAYLHVWDGLSGEYRRLGQNHTNGFAVCVALSPDGRWLLAAGRPAGSAVWDLRLGTKVVDLDGLLGGAPQNILAGAFSPDGRRLAVGGFGATPGLLEVGTWKVIRARVQGEGGLAYLFSPDSQRLFIGAGNSSIAWIGSTGIDVYDGVTGEPIVRMPRIPGWTPSVGITADGRRMIRSVMDNSKPIHGVDLWDAFPWRDADFAGAVGEPFSARVARFAEERHRERLAGAVPPSAREELPQERRSAWRTRDPGTPSACLDLTSAYNGHLETGWVPHDFFESFEGDGVPVPQGVVELAGVTWDVRGVVSVGRTLSTPYIKWLAGREVKGIPVGRRCRELHFLHGCLFSPEGEGSAGDYVLTYSDGTTELLPLRFGQDIGDLEAGHPKATCTNGQVAWEGWDPQGRNGRRRLRLYRRTWENPHPDKEILSFDLRAVGGGAVPFVVAVTVE